MYGFGAIDDCCSIGAERLRDHPAMGPAWLLRAGPGVLFSAPRGLGLDELYTRDDGRK
jgi:hypothetical protein